MTNQLIVRAKLLRKNSTDAENKLWSYLRNRQLGHLKFRRQVPMGNYIADFLCTEKKLIIELDGGQHAEQEQELYDKKRTLYLNKQGFTILRFWNNQVFEKIEDVLDEILNAAHLIKPPHPSLLPRSGGEGAI